MSEASNDPPQDDGNAINSPHNLALEATFINHNFSQQVVREDEEKFSFPEPNPFVQEDEDGEVASVGYRYRKWDLNNGITLVCRCEHDSVMHGPNGETQFINVKALNEWDSRVITFFFLFIEVPSMVSSLILLFKRNSSLLGRSCGLACASHI